MMEAKDRISYMLKEIESLKILSKDVFERIEHLEQDIIILNKENKKLREEPQDYKNLKEMLENEIERFKLSDRAACEDVSELRKKLTEYEKFVNGKE